MAPLIGRLVCLGWLVSLPSLTATRATVWSSDVQLWTAAARGSVKPRPWLNLASALIAAHRPADAAAALDRGLALGAGRPDAPAAYAYWQALSIDRALLEGRWTEARGRAIDLTLQAGTWPPAQARCAWLTC